MQVRREKGIYHTLNKLSVDVTRKVLVAEAWVPLAARARVQVRWGAGRRAGGREHRVADAAEMVARLRLCLLVLLPNCFHLIRPLYDARHPTRSAARRTPCAPLPRAPPAPWAPSSSRWSPTSRRPPSTRPARPPRPSRALWTRTVSRGSSEQLPPRVLDTHCALVMLLERSQRGAKACLPRSADL
mgnify:CR=1 FL=1